MSEIRVRHKVSGRTGTVVENAFFFGLVVVDWDYQEFEEIPEQTGEEWTHLEELKS